MNLNAVLCLLQVMITCVTLQGAVTEYQWSCTTPNGEDGECVTLLECQPLMEAFANPKNGTESHLKKFRCTDDDYFIVCCGLSSNFTIYNNNISTSTPSNNATKTLQSLSDLRYCGYQHSDDYPRWPNDTTKTTDEYPWLALIIIDTPTKYGYGCGTLINRRYVITSTPYIPTFSNYQFYPVTVRLGDFNIANGTDCVKLPQYEEECNNFTEYRVEQAITHPFYNFLQGLHSLTLLRLNTTVTYSDYIRPICLPIPGVKMPSPGDILHATGWGLTKSRDVIFEKKRLLVEMISVEQCNRQGGRNNLPVNEYNLCTNEVKNNSEYLCYGDEGIPVMYSYRNQWFLEGIAPWWKRDQCTGETPLVNTKVASYLEWIKENMML